MALLVAAGLSGESSRASAGLLDFFGSKKASSSRAQSPDPRYLAASQEATPTAHTAAPVAYDSSIPSGWGYDCSPCFNCGENDHYQHRTRSCRAMCKDTWYPRVAPYCQPSWGYTQPCWRRVADNYNCVRPDWRGSSPKPRAPTRAAPVEEPTLPEPPSLPTSSRPLPPVQSAALTRAPASQPVSYVRPEVRHPEKPVVAPPADPSRFTSMADTLESDADESGDDIEETLEAQIEADQNEAGPAENAALLETEE